MGILNDLKKIFFGAESLGKSAINKTKEAAEAAADNVSKDILDKTSGLKDAIIEKTGEAIGNVKNSDTFKKASTSLDDLSEKIQSTASDLSDKAEAYTGNLGEKASETFNDLKNNDTFKKATESLDNISDKIQDRASDFADKAADKVADVSETIGTTIFGENNERLEKLQDITEDIGKKVSEVKDKVVEQAQDLKENIDKKIDQTLEDAKEAEAKEKFEKQKRSTTPPTSHGDSTLDGSDDFFSKAEKYADGDYSVFSEGNITIDKKDIKDAMSDKISSSRPPNEAKAAGFDDLDGDGNEIVDDAIIDDEGTKDT